ncbi:hypothetical protein [Nocardioides pyridinolyticus]
MTRTRSLVGLALASTVLLTGCSATGGASGWNPNVAARVADDTISLSEANDTAAAYCGALLTNPENDQVVPGRYVGARVVASLVLRSAAEQFAEEKGLTPHRSYDETVRQAEEGGAFADLTEEEREAVIAVDGSGYYVQAVQRAAGEDGEEQFVRWLDDHAPELDPRYGIAIEDGTTVPADTGVSAGVSEVAQQAAASEPDAAYAAGLPENQRCGG